MAMQAVIFDFGGVLMRTENHAGRRRWEARLGLPAGSVDALVFECPAAARATIGAARDEDVWNSVQAELKLDAAQLEEFRADFWSGDRLDYDLLAFLRGLRPRYRTALLSNAWPGARQLFHGFELEAIFDPIIISAEVGLAKPDARIYQLTVERLGLPPAACVFVDDVLANIDAARAAGLHGVHFKSAAQARKEIEAWLK